MTVQITFRFNLEKAVEVMAYLLARAGTMDKAKLMKLVYLADRTHFIRHGVPITGDRLCAMPLGPVPCATLDAVNGELWSDAVFRYLHVDDCRVELRATPPQSELGERERRVLDEVVKDHGSKSTSDLVKETRGLPEFIECYVEGTSRPIPYERIAQLSGDESRFRLNRAVVSPETASQMVCPFPPDSDL